MTVKDVLKEIKDSLGKIQLNVDQVETIGVSIARACNGLNLCIAVLQQAEDEAKVKAEAKEETESEENSSDPESVPEVIEIEPEEVEDNG